MNEVAEMEVETQKQQIALFEKPRLPWRDSIGERFGITLGDWMALCDVIQPGATTASGVLLYLQMCRSRNLDPMKKPFHIVPMWSKTKKRMVETVWPSINELRTTASRTNLYHGCAPVEFGPMVTREFLGKLEIDRNWVERAVTVTFPEWARFTVYKFNNGQRCAFTGPMTYWLETYATIGRTELPNEMWVKRARSQLEKCAEAAALRRAFPEEIGNEQTAEEMVGRVLNDAPAAQEQDDEIPQPTPKPAASSQKPRPPVERTPDDEFMDLVATRAPDEIPDDHADETVPNGRPLSAEEEAQLLDMEIGVLQNAEGVRLFAQTFEDRLKSCTESKRATLRKAYETRKAAVINKR